MAMRITSSLRNRMDIYRQVSSSVKAFSSNSSVNPIDTLVMAKTLESKGLNSEQAEGVATIVNGCFKTISIPNIFYEEASTVSFKTEVMKLEAAMKKLEDESSVMHGETKNLHDKSIQELKEMGLKEASGMKKEFQELKVEFERTKHLGVTYAVYTLASVAAGGVGMYCLTL